MHTLFHVFGSGDAIDPSNHIARARLNVLPEKGVYALLYGRQQPGMSASEASLAHMYLKERRPNACVWTIEKPKSTSESLGYMAIYVHDSITVDEHGHVSSSEWDHHIMVTNWPYVWRTRYLLRKQWQRMYSAIPWSAVSSMVTVKGVGGTFVPYFQEKGWKAIPWWLWKVGVREILAWGKALVDPYDERLNQKRGAAKVF